MDNQQNTFDEDQLTTEESSYIVENYDLAGEEIDHNKADMVMFYEPNMLEFFSLGHSHGTYSHPDANKIFGVMQMLSKLEQAEYLQSVFDVLRAGAKLYEKDRWEDDREILCHPY
ncbi:MAG: hypothetical protein JKY82_10815 [Rhizobiaceae bacterium]|nr:hypothetical protein [Rhizobiaceae bacterium]